MSKLKHSKGDTIVEVVLAMALLSMILTISWSTVNRATQISTNARKRVRMVNALKEQAEVLKARFKDVGGNGNATQMFSGATFLDSGAPGSITEDPCTDVKIDTPNASLDTRFFYYNPASLNTATPSNKYLAVDADDSARVWIQYKNDVNGKFTDYYVRGCWLSAGSGQVTDNSQFIVRLNK